MSKKRYNFAAVVAAVSVLTAGLISQGVSKPADCPVCAPQQAMREISTMELVKDMGLGVNLGNTFESQSDNVNSIETAWGSPVITKEIIAVYPTVGFKTVRVPVRWTNAMIENTAGGSYTINPVLMDRVQEVVDWILDEDMYVILNIHHENWIRDTMPDDSAEVMRKYLRIWEQVAERFKDYDDKLMFEGLNEEGHWNDVWYIWSNGNDLVAKARAYGLLKTLNQGFVNLVRASGGNNGDRHLLVSGYETNIDRTIDEFFEMPDDPRDGDARLAVSIHYYDPFCFTHGRPTDNWDWCGGLTTQWGTASERNALNSEMNKLKTNLVDRGIPVIVGEYGAAWEGRVLPQDTVRDYTLSVAKAIYERGMLPILWDTQLNPNNNEPIYYFNRRANPPAYPDQLLVAGFRELAGLTPLSVRDATGVKASNARPSIAVKGRLLTISAPAAYGNDVSVKLIDVKGRVRANFKTANGIGNFNLSRIPAGRYFVEVRGASGAKNAIPVTLR